MYIHTHLAKLGSQPMSGESSVHCHPIYLYIIYVCIYIKSCPSPYKLLYLVYKITKLRKWATRMLINSRYIMHTLLSIAKTCETVMSKLRISLNDNN